MSDGPFQFTVLNKVPTSDTSGAENPQLSRPFKVGLLD